MFIEVEGDYFDNINKKIILNITHIISIEESMLKDYIIITLINDTKIKIENITLKDFKIKINQIKK